MIARSIVIPFLFALLYAQSHSILEIETKNEFTAEFITTEPYYASLMPVLIQIQFSSPVADLDETHFLTTNGYVTSVKRESDSLYAMQLIANTAGEVTVMASKYIQSSEGYQLSNVPTVSFYYKGARIAPIQIVKQTSSEVEVTLSIFSHIGYGH